jgi:hypothetical protein
MVSEFPISANSILYFGAMHLNILFCLFILSIFRHAVAVFRNENKDLLTHFAAKQL